MVEITEEMIKNFNQKVSLPIKNDLENIQNRAISNRRRFSYYSSKYIA